jgi:hypothetical protein
LYFNFYNRHFTLPDLRRLRPFGSEHFAILVELMLDPDQASQPPQPEIDRDDADWAQRIVEREKVSMAKVPEVGPS